MNKILTIILVCISTWASAQLRINELSAHDGFSINGETHDWLEVMNVGGESIFLNDYFLTDNPGDLQKWHMPIYHLQPQEIILIAASGNNISNLGVHWESLVNSDNTWNYLVPTSPVTNLWIEPGFDDSAWETAPGGFGYADNDDNVIIPQGSTSVYQRIEFDVSDLNTINNLEIHADFDDGFVAYLNGTEVARSFNVSGNPPAFDAGTSMYHEASLTQGFLPEVWDLDVSALQSGTNTLAIHTLNVDNVSSDFTANYFLLAEISTAGIIYQNTPNWFNESIDGISYFHTNFKLKTGETLIISHESGVVQDSHFIPEDLSFGISKGRFPDGTGEWCYMDSPSPDESNSESWCFEGISAPPETNLESGWYSGTQSITASADAVVRFTLNGDYPDENDPIFSTAEFSENTSLSLRSFSEENLIPSPVVDRTYVFSEDNHDLPVISLHTDEAGLFDFNTGLYEFGPNANLNDFPYYGSNFWEPWSRFARLEYFNSEKELLAEAHLDLEIHGGWSRAYSQKSFRLDFKGQYTGNLEVSVFDKKPFIQDFNNINIRNGGQHVWGSKIQDGLFGDLVNGLNVDNVGYEACLLYLNGEFWGIYGIREKVDTKYVENNHGIDSDNIDLLNSWGALDGTEDHFNQAISELMALDANNPEFYGLFASKFDLDNYMDYFIAETYVQNSDWMGIAWGINNVKLWRPQTEDGKWRYVMYDTDAGFGFFFGVPGDNYLSFARSPSVPSEHSELFNKVLQNEQFKCEFAQRYADLINTTFQSDNFDTLSDQLRDSISGAMPDHINRWSEMTNFNNWQDQLESIKDYNSQRVGVSRIHVNEELQLGGQALVTLNVQPEGAGVIQINSVTPDSYPWSGIYFNGCPIEITAIANEGFTFSNWSPNQEFSESIFTESLLSNLIGITDFTAFFTGESSVNEVETSASISVHPNPTTGEFTVEFMSSQTEDLKVEVFNALGKLVLFSDLEKRNRVVKDEVDLSSFPSGIFVVKVYSKSGVHTARIIKE